MGMKGCIFLPIFLNLVVSSFSTDISETIIIDISNGKNSTDANQHLILDDIRKPTNTQRSTILGGDGLWTSPVPYVLDTSLDLNARGAIMRALDQFRVKSCIDFKPRDSEAYYLSIKKLSGCWSYIGRTFANGQDVSIGAGCDYVYIIEHEILHALGFYHEQSRYDRDNYVQIIFSNILSGKESNFDKVGSDVSTTHGTPYDYWSVMHYGKDAFTNGNGSTIITLDPKFQDVIGQNLDMSFFDAEELNLLYNCNSSVAFKMFCGFSNGTTCQMNRCSQGGNGWELVTQVTGGPSSDHTSLPSGNGAYGQEQGYFMHASTASGQEGDSAKLETQIISPKRGCNVQCLQFYYFHSGNVNDKLNIWIREFQDNQDSTGTLRLVGQITGPKTSYWKLQQVSLNATKNFQVVFEVRKGAGSSTGGFSIDDINLSETECPHVTIQIDDFVNVLNTSLPGTAIYSPRQYSKEGYAYRVAVKLYQTYVGMYMQLLSGVNDNQLEWPCLQRQMIFQMLDQTPNKQLQMSKQRSFVSSGTQYWNSPRQTGFPTYYENSELVYGGYLIGYSSFVALTELQYREFLKGGSAIFMFNFEDLTPLVNGSTLPCPQLKALNIQNPPSVWTEGPCSSRNSSTSAPPATTTTSPIAPTSTTTTSTSAPTSTTTTTTSAPTSTTTTSPIAPPATTTTSPIAPTSTTTTTTSAPTSTTTTSTSAPTSTTTSTSAPTSTTTTSTSAPTSTTTTSISAPTSTTTTSTSAPTSTTTTSTSAPTSTTTSTSAPTSTTTTSTSAPTSTTTTSTSAPTSTTTTSTSAPTSTTTTSTSAPTSTTTSTSAPTSTTTTSTSAPTSTTTTSTSAPTSTTTTSTSAPTSTTTTSTSAPTSTTTSTSSPTSTTTTSTSAPTSTTTTSISAPTSTTTTSTSAPTSTTTTSTSAPTSTTTTSTSAPTSTTTTSTSAPTSTTTTSTSAPTSTTTTSTSAPTSTTTSTSAPTSTTTTSTSAPTSTTTTSTSAPTSTTTTSTSAPTSTTTSTSSPTSTTTTSTSAPTSTTTTSTSAPTSTTTTSTSAPTSTTTTSTSAPTSTTTTSTTINPPPTTTDDSIFGFSPGMVASPILTFLLALLLLMP